MNEYHFTITNLNCAACSKVCIMILKKIDGVFSVDIQDDGSTKVTSNKLLDAGIMLKALKDQGYEAVTA